MWIDGTPLASFVIHNHNLPEDIVFHKFGTAPMQGVKTASKPALRSVGRSTASSLGIDSVKVRTPRRHNSLLPTALKNVDFSQSYIKTVAQSIAPNLCLLVDRIFSFKGFKLSFKVAIEHKIRSDFTMSAGYPCVNNGFYLCCFLDSPDILFGRSFRRIGKS